MAITQKVITHHRRYKTRVYWRKKRVKPKKTFILPTPKKLYPVTDKYGLRRGWSVRPPRR